MIWGFISSTIMSNSFFLFIMLLAFKRRHLISALNGKKVGIRQSLRKVVARKQGTTDLQTCIPLRPLSACTF